MAQTKTLEMSETDAVALLYKCGALLRGKFKLASGNESDYYFDSKQLTLDPEGAYFVAKQLVRRLESEDISGVGGMAYSAIPIVSNICLVSFSEGKRAIPAFYVRLSAKGHGRRKLVEGKSPDKGTNVAIVDDVVTTGDSILQAVHQAEDEGYKVSTVVAILDRNEGGREAVELEGYNFWALFTMSRTPDGELDLQFNGYPSN